MYTATAAHDVNDVDALTNGIAYILHAYGRTYLKAMFAQINRRIVCGDVTEHERPTYTAFLFWCEIYLSLN